MQADKAHTSGADHALTPDVGIADAHPNEAAQSYQQI